MLQLKNITKNYLSGENEVQALKGINIEFRKSEFVSILGPSGCGKTTLLNIIGGLDRYTSGDLIINGKSTKEFKDRDWDTYRNYSIGFVFQNYNLIPHQTVLSNVELALTLSGVSKTERRTRAIKVLEKVGLGDQIHKKPNQMSGGQMQRVAIARALVNNPDIILADEPTGALDTATSVQIMEILKEISKEKLIIMVTHNPELAEKYSSRIIKVLDGKVIEDTNPYEAKEQNEEEKTKKKRTSMKFFTALRLSFNNLLTKKGRTFLTAFAGSIGIIGIALILAISNGVQNYIDKVQEDTLSSYPITIEEQTIDMASMMNSLMQEETEQEHEEGKIYSKEIIGDMLNTMSKQVEKNNLEEFKKYLDNEENEIRKNANAIQYKYNLNINLYSADTKEIVQVNPSQVMKTVGFETDTSSNMGASVSIMGSNNVWQEMLDNEELLKSQYDVLAGKWPEKYNEVVLIVNENNEISDYTLYSLGLKDQKELKEKMKAIEEGKEVEKSDEEVYETEELLKLSFKLVLNTDYYQKKNGVWEDKSEDEEYMKKLLKNAEDIKIVGIIKPNESAVNTALNSGIGYTKELNEYVINKINNTEIVKEQKKNKNINVFTGIAFPKDADKASFSFNDLSNEQKMKLASLSQEELAKLMQTYTENAKLSYEDNLQKLGVVNLEQPKAIYIYPINFESKDAISNGIEQYNTNQRENNKEENVITYTDMVGILMSSVTVIVDVISYVLIAFVSISLVVSSIMIGIITYISVLERIKEIGILRAIGASKKDISRVFNAETLIVGLVAGALGIGITILLCIPINGIITALSGVSGVKASVPFTAGVVLVIISMVLTMIAGLIPAKMASKKDPVEALRTE